MNRNSALFLPAGFLLVGVLFVSGVRQQHIMKPVEPMRDIPTSFAGMTGRDTTIDIAEQKVAGMSDFVLRNYRGDSTQMFSVYVGYYERQVQGKTIHSPKNCLPGAGWEIVQNGRVPVTNIAGSPLVNRVVLQNRGVRALVYYWYQGRGRIESSEYRVKWDLMRDAAMYGRTEEALVRIVIPMPPAPLDHADDHLIAADSLARSIAAPLATSVYKVLPPFQRS
jgi:EpsI family protein